MAPCDILKQALRVAGAASVTVSLNQFGDLKKANQTKTTRHSTRKQTNGTKSKQRRQSENYHYTTTLMM